MKANASAIAGLQPGIPPDGATVAIEAWNLMGGLKWEALEYVVERFGIDDVDAFVEQLAAIRDHQRREHEAERMRHG